MDVDVDGVHPPRSVDPALELKHLANALYHARVEGSSSSSSSSSLDTSAENSSSSSSSNTSPILQSALQHFALTRSHLRKQALSSKRDKARVAGTRQRLDSTYLALQNRKYEINHLLREIEKCNDYDSIYQDLPLIDESEYTDSLDPTSEQTAPSDPHELMVARLKHEVETRQRAQAELKTLLASKTKVIKETEIRKASLEQLEKQLDEFVASAKAIQEKFSRMQ